MVKKEFIKVISHSEDDRIRLKIETEKGRVEQDIKDRWKWYRDRYKRRLRK